MLVGRVGRPHGLDGSFVVVHPSDAPERFAVGARLYAGGEEAEVVAAKRAGGSRLVIRLDCPVARGAALEVDRAALPPPEPDAYYVFQLVGLRVEEEGGRELGRVAEVEPGIANDALALDWARCCRSSASACSTSISRPGRSSLRAASPPRTANAQVTSSGLLCSSTSSLWFPTRSRG